MGRKGKAKNSHGRVRPKKHQSSTNNIDGISNQQETITPLPEWVININNCLKEGPDLDSGRSWTIYRVPKKMVEVHKSAYIPKIISIGPFHCNDLRVQAMEEHKMRYLFRVLGYKCTDGYSQQLEKTNNAPSNHEQEAGEHGEPSQLSRRRKDIQLECLERAMKGLERKTRERYSEMFYDIDSDDFVQMMVIDGCFVIELLRLYHKYYFADEEATVLADPIFTTRWMLRSLQRDLLMLQNQLPFFVLEELFNLTSTPGQDNVPLIELALKFFDPLIPRERINKLELVNNNIQYEHLLDLLWTSFVSSIKKKKPISSWKKPRRSSTPTSVRFAQEKQLVHTVRELEEVGVEFMKKEENVDDLLDIDYENGVLWIPPLYLDDNTVPLFLNFVAYEQCDQEAEPYFTNYFMFFDSLVDSSKDVEILHSYGIINHVLGSEKDVANLFNKLCREIVYDVDNCHLSKQSKGVNDYYKAYYATRWHVWWTNLIREYFTSPWAVISLLAAIVLLLLTIAQTLFAVFDYFKQPN